jgi:transmembrane sensor
VTGSDDRTGPTRIADPDRDAAAEWLLRLNAAPDDPALRAALADWLARSDANRVAYDSVARMWEMSARLPAGCAAPAPASPLRSPPPAGRRGRVATIVGGALAACLVLAFMPTLLTHLRADYVTGAGEVRRIALEDGSIVHLDGGSAIAVRYRAGAREVALLSGQAFFEVVKMPGRPFVVGTDEVRTTVTGTAFGVRSAADEIAVALDHGAVTVALGDTPGHSASLVPGDRVAIDRATGRFTRTGVRRDEIAAWRDRRLIVHGAPIARVIDDLDRHFAGTIVLADRALGGRRVTGTFDLARPAEALQAIARTQGGRVFALTPWLLVVTGP